MPRNTSIYFLHVDPDGSEQRYHGDGPPPGLLTLRVQITERKPGAVTEKTWTFIRPGEDPPRPPPGIGWVHSGREAGSNVWVRVRETSRRQGKVA